MKATLDQQENGPQRLRGPGTEQSRSVQQKRKRAEHEGAQQPGFAETVVCGLKRPVRSKTGSFNDCWRQCTIWKN